MKVYPSKRVKNYASKKLRNIFEVNGKVVLKHAKTIKYDGDRCYGLCFSSNKDSGFIHRVIIAEDINRDMETYMSTLLHEYVHIWQFENDYLKGNVHGKKSKFKAWAKYIKETQGVEI
jgi:hypothetical protein